jgi:Protein of unknown function (DUF2934)
LAGTKEDAMNSTYATVTDDEIARRAYEIWQARGCPQGDGQEDWETAKSELMSSRIARNGSTQQRLQSWWRRITERMAGQV